MHSRRRRILSPSSVGRESMTLLSSNHRTDTSKLSLPDEHIIFIAQKRSNVKLFESSHRIGQLIYALEARTVELDNAVAGIFVFFHKRKEGGKIEFPVKRRDALVIFVVITQMYVADIIGKLPENSIGSTPARYACLMSSTI